MQRCTACGRRFGGEHPGCPPRVEVQAPQAPPPKLEGVGTLEPLGSGGFGQVFAGRLASTAEPVAIKLATAHDTAAAAALENEARALTDIGAPTAPRLVARGATSDGTPYLVLERLAPPTLGAQLEQHEHGLDPPRLRALAQGLASALARVHQRGWLWLDLKPENVLVASFEAPRLIDFGASLSLQAPWTEGRMIGTAEYMSPEQCRGERPDARADLYAWGVVLFECATGRPPFFGSAGDVAQAHLARRPPRPSSLCPIDPSLEAAILRCLSKRPADRPASAGELLELLAQASPTASATPKTPEGAPAPSPGAAPRRTVAAAFANAVTDLAAVRRLLKEAGGALAHSERGKAVFAFDADRAENPVIRAAHLSSLLQARGLVGAVRIDVEAVLASPRPDGQTRYLSAGFTDAKRYPAPGELPLTLTGAACASAPDLAVEAVLGSAGLLRLRSAEGASTLVLTPARSARALFLGRSAELTALEALAARAAQGESAVAQVLGDEGLGKSALLGALAQRLERGGLKVVQLKAVEQVAGQSDPLLPALLLTLLELREPPSLERLRAAVLGLLGEAGAEVLPALGLALGLLEPTAPQLAATSQAPGALRLAIASATAQLLHAVAARQPVAVLLDDAHLASLGVLDALELGAYGGSRARVLVAAAARPSFAAARPQWLERAAATLALTLPPLAPEESEALCRALLLPADHVPLRVVERLVARTAGSPRLLVEVVRGLKQRGLVRQHAGSEASYVATDALEDLPELPLLDWLAARTIDGLSAELLAHARLAALLGPRLAASQLSGVLERLEAVGLGALFPLDARASLEALTAAGVLERRDGAHAFRLVVVRELLEKGTAAAQAQAIHAAAAQWLSAQSAGSPDADAVQLARHLAGAGNALEAAAHYEQLAARAVSAHDYFSAESAFGRVLELVPAAEQARRMHALHGRGLMRYRLSRHGDSLEDFRQARELAHALAARRDEALVLLAEATALDWMADYEVSAQRAQAARALAGASPDRELEGRLLLGEGRSQWRYTRRAEAAQSLALAVERAADDYETRVDAMLCLTSLLPALGRSAESAALIEQLVQLTQERGDKLHLIVAWLNGRNTYLAAGDVARALGSLGSAMQLARELGLVIIEFDGEYNTAEIHYQLGDLEQARPHLARAVELEHRHPEITSAPVALLLEARLLAWSGDSSLGPVLGRIGQAVEQARAANRQRGQFLPNERVLFEAVSLLHAGAPDAAWEPVCEASSKHSIEQEPIEVLELRGLAALRRGDRQHAVRWLSAAQELGLTLPNVMQQRIRRALEAAGPQR